MIKSKDSVVLSTSDICVLPLALTTRSRNMNTFCGSLQILVCTLAYCLELANKETYTFNLHNLMDGHPYFGSGEGLKVINSGSWIRKQLTFSVMQVLVLRSPCILLKSSLLGRAHSNILIVCSWQAAEITSSFGAYVTNFQIMEKKK